MSGSCADFHLHNSLSMSPMPTNHRRIHQLLSDNTIICSPGQTQVYYSVGDPLRYQLYVSRHMRGFACLHTHTHTHTHTLHTHTHAHTQTHTHTHTHNTAAVTASAVVLFPLPFFVQPVSFQWGKKRRSKTNPPPKT